MWLKDLNKHENKIYSQGGQDGVIEYILSNIKIKNKFCVEFGYSQTGYIDPGTSGPNCSNLILHKGWDHIFLDGGNENHEINLYKHFLTTENIIDVFKQYNVPKDLGFLSVDVDTIDLWLTDKLLEEYRPSLLSMEFNPNIPIDYAITLPNSEEAIWKGKRMGCSLKCADIMTKKHNYSLVYAGKFSRDGHHDAFFIDNNLIKDVKYIPTLEDFRDTHESLHEAIRIGKNKICLDYEHYLKTGNITESQQVAYPISFYYMCFNWENL